ncbi:uncharacterized protein LOC116141552 [Pistacia vera]|uniref:uncharacterized protein LOC116141552 n=1 Tax=Pistacia vera TaxID=55513 RepID=UPI00126373D0|nr:uncharacterized protein LOC116141552 [Pistacia vera]
MSGVSYIVFFFISHLLILSLAQEEMGSSPKCKPFNCGILNVIGFPFSNETYPECGFLTVAGCREQVPRIRLGKDGPEFHVLSISKDNTLTLRHDEGFEKPPLNNRRCVQYFQNLTIPSSPFFSFEVIPENQTLFKCPGTSYSVPENYDSLCNDSSHSIIYYKGSKPGGLRVPPQQCSLILFQTNRTPNGLNFSNLYTGWFRLQVKLKRDCHDCHGRKGQCKIDSIGNFYCANAKDGQSFLNVGLAIGNVSL